MGERDAQWVRARSDLALARFRVEQAKRAFGRADRDLIDRLDRALRQVWHLETLG